MIRLPRQKKINLKPGLSLWVETHPAALSSAVGIFFAKGSRHEPKGLEGVCHLLEHFLFKGTTQMSADEISRSIERHGGEINAYTDRELTCFHATMPHDKWDLAFEVLWDMIFDARLDPEEFVKEREVVIQELKGYEDSAEDEFWDLFFEQSFGNQNPVGRRIAGLASQIPNLSYEKVTKFIQEEFLPAEKIIVVVSPYSAKEIEFKIREHMAASTKHLWADSLKRPVIQSPKKKNKDLAYSVYKQSEFQKFDSDQVYVGFSYPGVAVSSRDEVNYSMVATLLGGGSSSKLYKEIREEHGLAYSAGAFLNSHSDSGLINGYFVTDKKKAVHAVSLAAKVCSQISRGIEKQDFLFLKDLARGSLYLGFEGVAARMEAIGRQCLLLGYVMNIEDTLKDIERLTIKKINEVLVNFAQEPFLFALGPVSRSDFAKYKKAWVDSY